MRKCTIFSYGTTKIIKKVSEGEGIKRPARPRKDGVELPPSVQQLSKFAQLRYELASKEKYLKRLEMENELIWDFLSFTERN